MLESSADQEARIRQNRTIVAEQFNLRHYGEHLADIYRTVAGSGVSSLEPLDASLLLDKFLAPERFCLLRT